MGQRVSVSFASRMKLTNGSTQLSPTWFTDAFVWPPKIEQGHVLEAKRTASADVWQTQALNKELQG